MRNTKDNKDRDQGCPDNGANDNLHHSLYRAAQPINLTTKKIKFQSPEDWISSGMDPELPPEYSMPADIADMKRPEGMTRYQCRLMHLVFATMCRNKSPKFLIHRTAIGKFVTGDEKNIRSDRIQDAIDGLADLKFVFAATSLRLRNLKPWGPISLFASKPVVTRGEILFEIHPDIYKAFLDPKIYEFISLETVRRIRSEPALFLYPVSQIRLHIQSGRMLRELRRDLDFSSPEVNTEAGVPSRIEDISTWLGLKYSEPARVISDLKRASKALTRDLGECGLPRLDVFGAWKDDQGKVIKDADKKKYLCFNFTMPPRPIFYENFERGIHDYYYYRLKAPHALFVKPGHMKATATAIGWNPLETGAAKAIKVFWMRHVVDLGEKIFTDYDRVEEIYSSFHKEIVEKYRGQSVVEIPTSDEADAVVKAWEELTAHPALKKISRKLEHVPDIKISTPSAKTEEKEKQEFDEFGIPVYRTPVRKHRKLSELEIGWIYLRDPRQHDAIYDGKTLEFLEPGAMQLDFMEDIYEIEHDQIPFLNAEQIGRIQRQLRRPAYIDDLLKARKVSTLKKRETA